MPRVEATEERPGYWVPLVTVVLRLPAVTASFTALVDSGADMTILPAELVEAFKVPWSSIPGGGPGQGVGGGFEIRTLSGDLSYHGVTFATSFAVAEPGHLPRPLLGRGDFFQRFVLRFNWHKATPEFHADPVTVGKGRSR